MNMTIRFPPDPAPPGFTWPGGKTLAFSLVVNVEEGAERSILKGDKAPEPVDELMPPLKAPIRVHGNESSYQYGINRGAPRVLERLERFGVPATWTICAEALEKAPWLGEAIATRGDEPANHGYRWLFTFNMSEAEERDFVQRGTDSIAETCGRKPVGYLSRYLHRDELRGTLADLGYLYHMDDYSDDFPRWEQTPHGPIVVMPYAVDSNDMKFWLSPAFTAAQWVDYAKATFDTLLAESRTQGARMMSLGLHLRIIGRPGRIGALDEVLDYVTGHDEVWIATREQIAEAFKGAVDP
ncbi:MAG: polysaccharide deacetylase family protein [Pseudomonadota bacterium]